VAWPPDHICHAGGPVHGWAVDYRVQSSGTTSFFTDLLDDRDYAIELLDYVTDATIARIRAYRKRLDMLAKLSNWWFADDSIQLISCDTYRELVFPRHKRLIDELTDGSAIRVHLCGDSSRHFEYMREHLNVDSFDTGFPIDYSGIRRVLGPDVEILGGPTVPFLKSATPNEVRKEIKRILTSGVTDGKRFILREANNLAPDVPVENMMAMYNAGKEFGTFA